jgi:hypothetical protein
MTDKQQELDNQIVMMTKEIIDMILNNFNAQKYNKMAGQRTILELRLNTMKGNNNE